MSKSTIPASAPTRPRPVDAAGFELDEWGLPLSGPRRRAVLAAKKRRDPHHFPEDWAAPAVSIAPQAESKTKEDVNG